jgi:NAD(P)-dependent dehydrogenase (short-subunit alcohol dehydrogenase family)
MEDLVKNTADAEHQDGRIVFTASNGYRVATKLDYERLVTRIPDDGKRLRDVKDAFQLYVNSKLALIYGVQELAKRARQIGIKTVYINACHPGNAIRTRMGKNFQSGVSPFLEGLIRTVLYTAMGNSLPDCAKAQVYVSASSEVKDKDLHGLYWDPQWTCIRTYKGCRPAELTDLGRDQNEVKKLWEFTVNALKKALNEEQFQSTIFIQLRNV